MSSPVQQTVSDSVSPIQIDLLLNLGRVEQVTVNAETAGFANPSAVVGSINAEALSELPLDAGDVFKAAVLVPGVAPATGSAPSLLSNGGAGKVTINGMRSSSTNVLIDGADANDPVFGYSPADAMGLFLGIDAFESVRVLTQNVDLEYGTNGGGVIEAKTRSGSNQFHGSAFELHRNAELDARNYFDLPRGAPPSFLRNQFGATIGGPVVHDRLFFFAEYEGLRERKASTSIATVPNALSHQGYLPAAVAPSACSGSSRENCASISMDPRILTFLDFIPLPNGTDNGDGTGDLITADAGSSTGQHGTIRVDDAFSKRHSLFVRHIIDDSSSRAPSIGHPPGTYVPGFPALHEARNQYSIIEDQKIFLADSINILRFAINRTTGSTSIIDTHPGVSISLVPGRPFGTLEVAGLSLIGNSALTPLADLSTVFQLQDQFTRTMNHVTIKSGLEFRRILSHGPLDFGENGLYSFQDLQAFGQQAQSNNPGLEFFLRALPFSYVGTDPTASDSERSYRQNTVSGFLEGFLRLSGRLALNAGIRYDFYSNPKEKNGRLAAIRNPAIDAGPTVGRAFAETPTRLFSPQVGFAWDSYADGKQVLKGGFTLYRNNLPLLLVGVDRVLPPFYSIESFLFPSFLNPKDALSSQAIDLISTTYHPKFPYVMQYDLSLERAIGTAATFSLTYIGTRGNHLTREAEQNPYQPTEGHRYNPNLQSPLLSVLTDAQSFFNSFQALLYIRSAGGLSMHISYAFSHSIDDASVSFSTDSINDPPISESVFDRKASRGRSGFDIRQNVTADLVFEPFKHNRTLQGLEISTVMAWHTDVPFTPVLGFDNADVRSLLTSQRPNIDGDPYIGNCPNGMKVGSVQCWFNPKAFSVPPRYQSGNAGRNSLRGPGFEEVDIAIRKNWTLLSRVEMMLGVEMYNALNHPNLAVPNNTQSPLSLGGNGDSVFRNAAGDPAINAGRIFSTVGDARQIQLHARVRF